MADEKDPAERALEDLLAGLSAPQTPAKAKPEAEKPSMASSRDMIEEKAGELDDMAASLQELLGSPQITEQIEKSKAEEVAAQEAEAKTDMEDMESALASALAAPTPGAAAQSFDEIEDTWEEQPEAAATSLTEEVSAPAAPVDMSTLYQAPAAPAVEEVVVIEPEKLSERRKRFYTKTVLGVAAALLISFLFINYGIKPSLRWYYYHQLTGALKEKKFGDAEQYLITSESLGMTKERYMELSDLSLSQRDLPRSLGFARKASGMVLNFTPAVNRIAQVYVMQGRIDEAENQARDNLRIDPNNLQAYVILADAHFRKREVQKAQKVLNDVLARERSYVPALELLRDIYIELKNYNQALSLQTQLTSVKKDIPEPQRKLDLGKIYYSANRFAAANGLLKEAYEADPSLWEAGYYLAKTQIGLGYYYFASEQITRTLKETPSPTMEMYYLRALANYHLGNLRTTIEELQRIRTINPRYAPLYVLMGKIYVTNYGEYVSGLKFLEIAKELDYSDDDFQKTLGIAYFHVGRYRDAYEAWYPLLARIDPQDPFLFQISACLMHLKQMDLAQAVLYKMWTAGSRSTAIYNNLGVINELQGKRDMALRFYFQATERAITQGRKDSLVPKRNFDRLISGRQDLDINESLLLRS